MGKGSLRSKTDRTTRLLGLLRSDEYWTTTKLAQELDVSHRTLMRDLDELKSAGYPVEAERGRGGGIRLVGRWGIERLNLSNQEVISLLLSLSVTEALAKNSQDFGVKQLKQKLAHAFSDSQRSVISELRKRILIGKLASPDVVTQFKPVNELIWKGIQEGFFESKNLELEYSDEKGVVTSRNFDPHFMLLNWPVWYLLGWDYLRNDVRVLRVDRIRKLKILPHSITRRPRSLFLSAYEAYFKNL